MKKFFLLLIAVFFLFSLSLPSLGFPMSDTEKAKIFMEGISAYEKGDWPAAVNAFNRLAENGVKNGKLYYNLANAYLKKGETGRAILWYEKAKQFIPKDPDLRFNLDYAKTLTKDESGETVSPLVRILFFWKFALSRQAVIVTALVLNAAFWLVLSVRVYRKKQLLRTAVVLLGILSLIFSATAGFNYYESATQRHAVILSEQIPVRSGFSDNATVLFNLHAGTKVLVEKEGPDHYRIRYTRDKIGWIRKAEAGII